MTLAHCIQVTHALPNPSSGQTPSTRLKQPRTMTTRMSVSSLSSDCRNSTTVPYLRTVWGNTALVHSQVNVRRIMTRTPVNVQGSN